MTGLRFAVLGHPIGHSLSPAMHGAALAALGLPHRYEAIDVPDEASLRARVDEVRRGALAGANVTLPHKVAVLAMVDEVDESARAIGAANTLVRVKGRVVAHNTDIAGLADDLRALDVRAREAAVIGSGGAAIAAVAALRRLGASEVAVTSRSWTSRGALAASLAASVLAKLGAEPLPFPSMAEGEPFHDRAARSDVVVQATPAGMRGVGSGESVARVVPWARMKKSAVAYDLVYTPATTPFLDEARGAGLRAHGGLGMLARQGARALTLWLNVTPDVATMQRAAERALSEVST